MEIEYKLISYQDIIIYGGGIVSGDKYGYLSRSTSKDRVQTFINNPFIKNKDTPFLILAIVDGVIIGKRMIMPTMIKVSSEFVSGVVGSNYIVHKEFRGLGIGSTMMSNSNQDNTGFMFSFGCSNDSLRRYKKIGASLFLIKQFRLYKSICVIEHKNSIKGIVRDLANMPKYLLCRIKFQRINRFLPSLYSKFHIKQTYNVPLWVEEMLRNDKHKFMEWHGRNWLQWNLDYSFNDSHSKRDFQSFYEIWKENTPVGYFMTTVRERGKILVGSIVEWQSSDKELSEADINILAIPTFPKSVQAIDFASNDKGTIKSMKVLGFLQKGFVNMAVKDLCNRFENVDEEDLWRIRFGSGDNILS